jgi:hypothetical protein
VSTTQIIGGVSVSIGDDPIRTQYGKDYDGDDYAVLCVGHAVTMHISNATPEALQQLADAALELKAWRERQIAGEEGAA